MFIPDLVVHPFLCIYEAKKRDKQNRREEPHKSARGGQIFCVRDWLTILTGVSSRVFGYVRYIAMNIINVIAHALRTLTFRSPYVTYKASFNGPPSNVPTPCPLHPLRNDDTWARSKANGRLNEPVASLPMTMSTC